MSSSSSKGQLSSPGKVASLSSPVSEPDDESRYASQPDDEEDSRSACSAQNELQATAANKPDDEYFRPIKKLRMVNIRPDVQDSPQKPLTSFFIKDILNHKPTPPRRNPIIGDRNIVRPWDLGGPANASAGPNSRRRPRSTDDDSRSDKSESDSSESPAGAALNASPLDALFEMTSKAFEGLDADEKATDLSRDHLNLFSSRQQPKKKRKSRTAFTNHQIFELEKRFLYQKYLSPADRDEIAQSLGLTNAQVITWFQNRRAKLKRDMEELKKDVDAAKIQPGHSSRGLMENIQEMNSSKKDLSKALNC